jgi:hypothetical protein
MAMPSGFGPPNCSKRRRNASTQVSAFQPEKESEVPDSPDKRLILQKRKHSPEGEKTAPFIEEVPISTHKKPEGSGMSGF